MSGRGDVPFRPFPLLLPAATLFAAFALVASCSTGGRAPPMDASRRAKAMKRPLTRSASATKSGIDLECIVNLPGDVTSTNQELCPNFPMFATDLAGEVVARFKFSKKGRFRLPLAKDAVVFLHAEATDEWRMEFEPTGRYAAGMSVKVLFIRRP